jgi:hypothetical protein
MREVDSPFLAFVAFFVVQAIAAYVGDLCRRKVHPLRKDERSDLGIVGVTTAPPFSTLVCRYDASSRSSPGRSEHFQKVHDQR